MMIEQLWAQLAREVVGGAQLRVDGTHPFDIYADCQASGQVGLVAVCSVKPPAVNPMRAISVEVALRRDARWTLRLVLTEPALMPVFAALCNDILSCTRIGVDEDLVGTVVVQRITHWRALLERQPHGLGEQVLRGLIGELLVLRSWLVPEMGAADAVTSWRGPLGAPQDFSLPDGTRLEVKTISSNADQVRIHGLGQLDGVGDPLKLVVVRAEPAAPESPSALTAPGLVEQLRRRFEDAPEILFAFDLALAAACWHEHPSHDAVVLRVLAVDVYDVMADFPRLLQSTVPTGVMAVDYVIQLQGAFTTRHLQ